VRFVAGLVVGGALGYLAGAQAGRDRYEQIEALRRRAVDRLRPSEEATFEPGLEFNPDFSPTAEEIAADLRGEAPSA
jgi:hypothetical protein